MAGIDNTETNFESISDNSEFSNFLQKFPFLEMQVMFNDYLSKNFNFGGLTENIF